MRASLKKWRESASIILVAKTAFSPQTFSCDFNYKVLALKRSKQSGFLPGAFVFPGGNFNKADTSPNWLALYERFGFKPDSFEKLNPKENRPHIFKEKNADEIPRHISLRITAIRETFEECGILICRSFKMNYKERLARWASFIGGHEIQKWQKKVSDDPLQFYELCSKFEVYPDVWSLKEWSNWATPASMRTKFDTVFFLAALQQMPPTAIDNTEIQQLQWATPAEYIAKNKTEEILLPVPQLYEMSRLKHFSDISKLLKFAGDRACYGSQRYLGYSIATDTAAFTILPGDDLYPEDPTIESVRYMKTLPESKILHRVEHTASNHRLIIKNFIAPCNHIAPLENKL